MADPGPMSLFRCCGLLGCSLAQGCIPAHITRSQTPQRAQHSGFHTYSHPFTLRSRRRPTLAYDGCASRVVHVDPHKGVVSCSCHKIAQRCGMNALGWILLISAIRATLADLAKWHQLSVARSESGFTRLSHKVSTANKPRLRNT